MNNLLTITAFVAGAYIGAVVALRLSRPLLKEQNEQLLREIDEIAARMAGGNFRIVEREVAEQH